MNTWAALIHAGPLDQCETPLLWQGNPKKCRKKGNLGEKLLQIGFLFGGGQSLHCIPAHGRPLLPLPPALSFLGGVSPCILLCRCFSEHFCQQQLSDCLNSSNIAWPQHFWSATQLLLETGSMETNEEAVSVLVCWWRTESTSLNSSLASFQRNGSEGWWELRPRNKALSGVQRRFSCDAGWWFCPQSPFAWWGVISVSCPLPLLVPVSLHQSF